MKQTKKFFLLLIFILSFSLQGQAYAKNMPIVKSSSDYSPQTGGLSSTVVVYMYKLNENGSEQNVPMSICQVGDLEPGCGVLDENTGTVSPYPPRDPYINFFVNCPTDHPNDPDYCNNNPIKVDIENYYLKNVLPREMDVVGNSPTLEALKAQALAARSIADWKSSNWGQDPFKAIGNYTVDKYSPPQSGYQVFFPDAYDTYYDHNISGEKERVHALIDKAIMDTSGEYLFYPNNEGILSLDAEFSNDIGDFVNGKLMTVNGNQDYLIPIHDPISNGCDLNPLGNGWGMSQKGAIRWSKGNQCAGSGDQPWTVAWDDEESGYKQILAHYYTGIDILDGSGNKVAPDDRWNLLRWKNKLHLVLV